MGPLGTYQMFAVDGVTAGGIATKRPDAPAAGWLYFVNVDAIDAAAARVTKGGGKVTKVEPWGRRKLAYPINKFDEGIYTIIYLEGSGQELAEVERRLRVNDLAIRHIVVRTDEDLKRAEKMKSRRKTVAAPAGAVEEGDDDDDDDDFDS